MDPYGPVPDTMSEPDLPSPEPQPVSRTRRAGAAVVIALGALLLAGMSVLAVYTATVAQTSRQRARQLRGELAQMAADMELLAAEVRAYQDTVHESVEAPARQASAGNASPATVSAKGDADASRPDAANGMRMVVGRVRSSKPAAESGVSIAYQPATYYTGSVAFSVAASRGDVLEGDYYVDGTSTRTIEATILRKAPVRVYGWDGAGRSEPTTITPDELARVIAGGARPSEPWKDAWFWFEIGPGMAIVRVEQLPSQ